MRRLVSTSYPFNRPFGPEWEWPITGFVRGYRPFNRPKRSGSPPPFRGVGAAAQRNIAHPSAPVSSAKHQSVTQDSLFTSTAITRIHHPAEPHGAFVPEADAYTQWCRKNRCAKVLLRQRGDECLLVWDAAPISAYVGEGWADAGTRQALEQLVHAVEMRSGQAIPAQSIGIFFGSVRGIPVQFAQSLAEQIAALLDGYFEVGNG